MIKNNCQNKVCRKCKGVGAHHGKGTCLSMICSTCNGTGIYIEEHYIIIDELNKIAIDADQAGK